MHQVVVHGGVLDSVGRVVQVERRDLRMRIALDSIRRDAARVLIGVA